MTQSAVLALVHRLSDWLSQDAIRFEVLFVQEGDKKLMAEEATLMQLLLREPIERGDGMVAWVPDRAAAKTHLGRLTRVSQVHCLLAAAEPVEFECENAVVTELVVDGPLPRIGEGDGVVASLEGEDALDVWQETVLRILQLWV
jgi:hypothetical protein